jgi:hypothetical protein
MRLLIDNFRIKVTFIHYNGSLKVEGDKKIFIPHKNRYTMCKMQITNTKTGVENHLAGNAKLFVTDNFSRYLGRKISFRKVIQRPTFREVLNKQQRKKVIAAFFDISPKDKKIAARLGENVVSYVDRTPQVVA